MEVLPKVTVYITTYNRRELLVRAVNSVLSQSYSNIEVIVADDGSNDGTHEYLAEMEREGLIRTTVNESGKSKGACYGRNKAIEMSTGEFITGLDDDDYFQPWRIQAFLSYWDENVVEADSSEIVGLFDTVIEERCDGKHRLYPICKATYKDLKIENSIGNQIFTKVESLRSINGFDIDMPAWQDWDTWQRLVKNGGHYANINTDSYRAIQTHDYARISNKGQDKIRKAHQRLVSKNQPLTFRERTGILASLYAYKQVSPRINEIACLVLAGYYRRVAQVLKRQLLNVSQ